MKIKKFKRSQVLQVIVGIILLVFSCSSFSYALSKVNNIEKKRFTFDEPMVLGNVLVEVISVDPTGDGYDFTCKFTNIGDKTQKVTVSLEEGSCYYDKKVKVKKGEEKIETFHFEKTIQTPIPTYAVIYYKSTVYKTVLEMPSYLKEPIF